MFIHLEKKTCTFPLLLFCSSAPLPSSIHTHTHVFLFCPCSTKIRLYLHSYLYLTFLTQQYLIEISSCDQVQFNFLFNSYIIFYGIKVSSLIQLLLGIQHVHLLNFLYLNYSHTCHKLLHILSHKVNHRRAFISSSVLIKTSLLETSFPSIPRTPFFWGSCLPPPWLPPLFRRSPLSECFTGHSALWKACMVMALFSMDQEPSVLDPFYLPSGDARPALSACTGDGPSPTTVSQATEGSSHLRKEGHLWWPAD